jgi:hypothetical protein
LPRGGCPIRRPLDRSVPARPQSLSWRGHVLHRQQAPRHPPCAHLRGSHSLTAPRSPPGPCPPGRRGSVAHSHLASPRRQLPARGSLSLFRAGSLPHSVVRVVGWSRGDSNPGPPPCKGGALPAKLRPQAPPQWARLDSNQGPRSYQDRALTKLSYAPRTAVRRRRSAAGSGSIDPILEPRRAPGAPLAYKPVHRPPGRPCGTVIGSGLTILGVSLERR